MFKLDSEATLRSAFRPKDREAVELAAGVRFPMLVRNYLAWTHPAGGRVYLVFRADGGVPTGIVFDSNGAGTAMAHMCDWCHSSGSGSEIGLLTTYVSASRRAGVHVCSDLSCKQKLEDAANREGASAVPALERLVARMGLFASQTLKIDLSGKGR